MSETIPLLNTDVSRVFDAVLLPPIRSSMLNGEFFFQSDFCRMQHSRGDINSVTLLHGSFMDVFLPIPKQVDTPAHYMDLADKFELMNVLASVFMRLAELARESCCIRLHTPYALNMLEMAARGLQNRVPGAAVQGRSAVDSLMQRCILEDRANAPGFILHKDVVVVDMVNDLFNGVPATVTAREAMSLNSLVMLMGGSFDEATMEISSGWTETSARESSGVRMVSFVRDSVQPTCLLSWIARTFLSLK